MSLEFKPANTIRVERSEQVTKGYNGPIAGYIVRYFVNDQCVSTGWVPGTLDAVSASIAEHILENLHKWIRSPNRE